MRRSRVLASLAVATAATSASLVLLAAPAMAYPPGGGDLALSSSSVGQGGSDTGQGSGFTANELVNAYVFSAHIFVGTTTANAAGVATLTFKVPKSLATGAHHVEFVGQTSGQIDIAPLTVTAAKTVPSSSGSTLPFTGGSDIWQLTAIGAGLVLLGGGAVVGVRRRRTHAAAA
jgi:LPXTG-motif cell wall-anchored protein